MAWTLRMRVSDYATFGHANGGSTVGECVMLKGYDARNELTDLFELMN